MHVLSGEFTASEHNFNLLGAMVGIPPWRHCSVVFTAVQASTLRTYVPLSKSCSRGDKSLGISNTPVDIAPNSLYTLSPSKGNFPVVKWNLGEGKREREREGGGR